MNQWMFTIETARRLRVLQREYRTWLDNPTNAEQKRTYLQAYEDWKRVRWLMDMGGAR